MRATSRLGAVVTRHASARGGGLSARASSVRAVAATRGATVTATAGGARPAVRGAMSVSTATTATTACARGARGGSATRATQRSPAFSSGRLGARRSCAAHAGKRSAEETYPQLRVSAPGRVIAIGDLHGDIGQARRALRLAGVLGDDDDESGNPTWVGGDTTLVQVGDILDRGDDEIGILILLQKLDKEAKKQGGGVYVLNGNHEVLNVSGDFRYVSRGAFGETMRFSQHLVKLFGDKFRDAFGVDETDSWTRQSKARMGLFSPGGPLAQQLSMNHTVLIVNDTVFAHGGLVPRHVEFGLDKLNRAVTDWMRGKEIRDDETRQALGMAIGGVRDSIVWHRGYGTERFATDEERSSSCTLLGETLDMIEGVNRLVVGHTPQLGGANCECDGRIWRIDVGMSFGVLGADPQVLEINGQEVRVLTPTSMRQTSPTM